MHIPFILTVRFKLLTKFPVDHLHPTLHSYLDLYSRCAYIPLSLFIWLIVSSSSPYNQHLLFFRLVCSYLTYLILMMLFCAAIWRDSVSLLKYPFFNDVQLSSCKISLVCCSKCPYNCFYSHFCFLVIFVQLMLMVSVLFLVTVISLPPRFFMWSSSRYTDWSTLSSTLVTLFVLLFLTYTICLRHLL